MPSKCRSLFSRIAALLLLLTLAASFVHAGDADQDVDADRDHPAEREQWFLHGRSVKGRPAPELLERAKQQRDRLRLQNLLRRQVRTAATPAAGMATPVWTELGPAPMKSVVNPGDQQDYGVVTGRATTVVVDQNDPSGNTVYLGGAYGGLWKSTTAANPDVSKVFWTPLIDDQATTAVGSMAIQPGNPNLLIVGTGEGNSSTDSYYGLGILRSTDGGNSWALIASANGGLRPFHGLAFTKIAFSTDDTNIVVAAAAAASEGLTVGAEQPPNSTVACGNGNVVATCRGLYYSYDSGQTWTQATLVDPNGAPDNGSVSSVIYNPQQHKFYAAARAHGFYVSSDGITWMRMGNDPFGFSQPPAALTLGNCPSSPTSLATCPLYRGEIAQVPGRDEMYLWYVNSAEPPVNGGIYQTRDGGRTWTSLNVGGITNCGDSDGCGTKQGDYNLALAAVPNGATATDVYAGAVNIFKCRINSSNPTCAAQPFVNLTHVYGCSPTGSVSNVHPDQHGFDFLQTNPNIMYFANDGGIYRTLSSFSSQSKFCNASNGNISTIAFDNLNGTMGSMTQFVWFAQHPSNQYTMLGGTQDNGSPAVDQNSFGSNGLTWRSVLPGDGGYTDINPNNGNEWFSENTRVSLQRCTSGTSCAPGMFSTIVNSGTVGGDSAAFYMPFMLDPQDSTKIIVGTCRVWRVSTSGTNATKLSNKFDGSAETVACTSSGNNANAMVSALAAGGPATASGSQVIYAGTDDGRVFFTNSAVSSGSTWTNISAQGGFVNGNGYPISGIALDPRDATGNTAYVTVMGFGGSHVWQTTNAGGVWNDITGNLPDSPADAVVVNKSDGTIYVGTDVGVYATSTPAGFSTQWTEVGPATGNGALPNVAVTRLAIFSPAGQPARLRASTYGRGVWEMPLASPATPDYALAISNPDLLTYPGQSVTFNGTLTGFSGYSNAVNISCDAGVGGPLPSPCTPNAVSFVPNAGGTNFSVTAGNSAVQDFSFKIKGMGTDANALVRQQAVSLRVIDFSVGTPQPASIANLVHGDSTTIQLTATSLGSFDQQVHFGCNEFTLPAGWSCSSAQVTLTPGGTAQATLTLNTSAATAPGTYNIDVDGHWDFGGMVRLHSQPLPVTVIAQPGISVSSAGFTPNVAKIHQTLTGVITITPHDGYTGSVALSCTGTSAGISPSACGFSPATVSVINGNPVTSTLTVTTSSGTVGTGTITVLGADGNISNSTALPFLLTDYSITNVSSPSNASAGGNVSFTFKVVPSTGFNGSVVLSCSTVPSLSTGCSFSPTSPVTLTSGSTTQVSASLNVPAGTADGNYTLTLNSHEQSVPALTHSQGTAGFIVASQPDFTMQFSTGNSATVTAGGSTSSSVAIGSQGSFNSSVTFTVGGCPSLATCIISPNPLTPTANGVANATLSITTKAPSIAQMHVGARSYFAAWLAGSFGIFGLLVMRKQRGTGSMLVLICVVLAGMAGCGGGGGTAGGGGNAPPTPQPGTPAGTYTVTVTATSGTMVKTANFTLTVQ
ncbi:MAG TPA: NEW3 domain-containing protein [Terriglobales bacterium]|nr:NEW3 domain-containing protein [Terriglobales bacterium]